MMMIMIMFQELCLPAGPLDKETQIVPATVFAVLTVALTLAEMLLEVKRERQRET